MQSKMWLDPCHPSKNFGSIGVLEPLLSCERLAIKDKQTLQNSIQKISTETYTHTSKFQKLGVVDRWEG
jgi:hypothetical protein